MSRITEEQAHRMLWEMAQAHRDEDGKTVSVDVPDDFQAQEAELKKVQNLGGGEGAPRPGSVPARVGAAVTAAKPKVDLSAPLGYRPPAPAKDAELAGLQADAKKRRGEAAIGQAVADFTERPTNFLDYAQRLGGGGVSAPPPKNTGPAQHAAEGDRAIEDLEARRVADARADENDPHGETANTLRLVFAHIAPDLAEKLANATPKQMRAIAPWAERFAQQNADALKQQAAASEKARLEKKRDDERAASAATAARNRAEDVADRRANTEATLDLARAGFGIRKAENDRAAAKAAADAAEKAKGHPTSAAALTDLADAETAIGALTPLGQKFQDLDMSSTASKASATATDVLGLQGTDAAEYKAAALLAMQGVGKIMEGGKLAAGDEVKYRQMLPRPGDSEAIAAQKIKDTQTFLRSLVNERVKVLRKAGYNVPDVGGSPAPSAAAAPSGTVVITDKNGQRYDVPAAEAEALRAELRAEGLL